MECTKLGCRAADCALAQAPSLTTLVTSSSWNPPSWCSAQFSTCMASLNGGCSCVASWVGCLGGDQHLGTAESEVVSQMCVQVSSQIFGLRAKSGLCTLCTFLSYTHPLLSDGFLFGGRWDARQCSAASLIPFATAHSDVKRNSSDVCWLPRPMIGAVSALTTYAAVRWWVFMPTMRLVRC